MKRISSILVVTVMLITVALTMLSANSRTQNANRQLGQAPRPDSQAVQRIAYSRMWAGLRTPQPAKAKHSQNPSRLYLYLKKNVFVYRVRSAHSCWRTSRTMG